MERRKVLMHMGMSMGYVLAAPTFLSVLQSCESENAIDWVPTFFTQEQGNVLKGVVDAILPKTDTPAATEANVHIFLDSFVNEVMDKKQQELFKATLDELAARALKTSGKTAASEVTAADMVPVMLKALGPANDGGIAYGWKLRNLTVWAYKCNEQIGEEVMAYLPLPGEYIACGDVNDLTGGKDWSL